MDFDSINNCMSDQQKLSLSAASLSALTGGSLTYDDINNKMNDHEKLSLIASALTQLGGGGGGTTNYNSLTNKPKVNNVTLQGNKTLSDLGIQPAGDYALESEISGKANKISVVQTSASTIEINPNTFYKFGEVASLNITLASITDNTIYNEYMFEFVSGTTATTLTLPSSIKWLETPTIDANKIYQCSIVDNIGILVGVANV